MKMDTRNYVKGCDVCLRRKGPVKTKRAPMKIVEAGIPMERIATDILGELPETESGNRYILVISDYYTKWTESFPMPNMEARTVARIIVEKVITRFGVPSYIHSDQGKQYEGSLFHEMCRLLKQADARTRGFDTSGYYVRDADGHETHSYQQVGVGTPRENGGCS